MPESNTSDNERLISLLAGVGQLMAERAGSDQPLSDELLEAFDELVVLAHRLIQGDALGAQRASKRLDDIVARLEVER